MPRIRKCVCGGSGDLFTEDGVDKMMRRTMAEKNKLAAAIRGTV